MSDYPSLICHVFLAEDFEGEPTETEEAVPLWAPLDQIPYERMWEDDRHWLPLVLAGDSVLGKFVFWREAPETVVGRTGGRGKGGYFCNGKDGYFARNEGVNM